MPNEVIKQGTRRAPIEMKPTCGTVLCAREKAQDLSAGDMLFVPSGGAVSWRAKGVEDEAVVMRFCYVDASNFDSVKTQLPLYAAVEVSDFLSLFVVKTFTKHTFRCPCMVGWGEVLSAGGHHSVF